MTVLLCILKWLGIILLILLGIVLLLLILVLLVPIRYKASARVDDPEPHSEFPLSVFIERSSVNAEAAWFFGIIKIAVSYPAGERISLKIFGRDIDIRKFLKKQEGEPAEEEREEEEEQKEEEEETSLSERAEKVLDRIGRIFDSVDYIYRILTGSCGRRATEKILRRLKKILLSILPSRWTLGGTVGLSDPCLNGRMTGVNAVLMPVCDDHLMIGTQWEDYRFDLHAEMEGKIRLCVPVIEAVPLVFDKDCRKLYKKLMRARSRLAARTPEVNSGGTQNGTGLAQAS